MPATKQPPNRFRRSQLQVRVTESELITLHRAAKRKSVTLSEWARDRLLRLEKSESAAVR